MLIQRFILTECIIDYIENVTDAEYSRKVRRREGTMKAECGKVSDF